MSYSSDLQLWDPMTEDYSMNNQRIQEDGREFSKGLFVGRIPAEWNEVDLRDYMSRFGNVTSSRLIRKDLEKTGFSFGFVYYETVENAQKALFHLKNNQFNLKVEVARPQGVMSQQSMQRPARYSNEFLRTPNSDARFVLRDSMNHEFQPHEREPKRLSLSVHCSGDQRAVSVRTSPNYDVAANSHQRKPGHVRSMSMPRRSPSHQQTSRSVHFSDEVHYDRNGYGAGSIDTTNGDNVPAPKRLSFRDGQNLLAIDTPAQKSLRPVSQNAAEDCPQLGKLTSPCTNCGIEGEFVCLGCKTCYCSKNCQAQHWPVHMNLCLQKSPSISTQQDVKYQDTKQEVSDPSIKSSKPLTVTDTVKSSSHANHRGSHSNSDNSPVDTSKNRPILPRPRRELTPKYSACDLKSSTLSGESTEVRVHHIESLEEFYVHRVIDFKLLKEMQNVLIEVDIRLKESLVMNPAVGDLCVGLLGNELFRCEILQLTSKNECEVFCIDFGNVAVCAISNMWNCTEKVASYQRLAVRCQLNKMDTLRDCSNNSTLDTFKSLVKENVNCKVMKIKHPSVIVDLFDKGTSRNLWHMLFETKKSELVVPHDVSLINEIPSVFGLLEVGMKVTIVPVFPRENVYCSWIFFGDIRGNAKKMEAELQNRHGEDVYHVVDEGDMAISYSSEFGTWYRSYIMKRMKDSVKVRFIDYGNEEHVTKICKISKQHMSLCCPLVFFDLKNLRGDTKDMFKIQSLSATIKELSKTEVTVLFHLENIDISMHGTPWFTGLSMASQIVEVNQDHVANTKPSFPIPRQVKESPEKDMRLQTQRRFKLDERKLDAEETCRVKISWRHYDNNFLHIQKCRDHPTLTKLNTDLNDYCKSKPKSCYVPRENEIVFADHKDKWYRAQVLRVFPDNVQVCLVDSGVTFKVDRSNILPFDENFDAPKLACLVQVRDTSKLPQQHTRVVFTMKVIDANMIPPMVELCAIDEKLTFNSESPPTRVNSSPPKSVLGENRQDIDVAVKAIKKGSLKLALNNFHNATVCLAEIDELKVFHVQLTSNTEEYVAMKKEIQACIEKQWMSSYKPELEDLVAVTNKNSYHRGCILENRSDSCLVELIDAGVTQVISIKDIRPLTACSNLNTFCLAVELDGLKIQTSREELRELFLNVAMALEITDFNSVPVKGKFYVQGVCLNDQLLDNARNDSPIAASSNSPVPPVCKPKVLFESLACQTVPVNENVDVVFWVKKGNKYIMQLVSDVPSIKKMTDSLHEFCTKTEQLKTMPDINEVVCAQSKDDRQWYRACVTQHLSETKCEVTFFDYGNNEEMELSSLRFIPDEFATASVYGISVSVFNAPEKFVLGKPYTVAAAHLANCVIVSFVDDVVPAGSQAPTSHSIVPASDQKPKFMFSSLEQQTLPLHDTVDIAFCYKKDETYYLQKISDHRKLGEMMMNLKEHCSTSSPLDAMPSVGEMICAQSKDDLLWYRACVQKVVSGKVCEVLFIDYGNSENVELSCLRTFLKEFILPVAAIAVNVKNQPLEFSFGETYTVKTTATQPNLVVDFNIYPSFISQKGGQRTSPNIPSVVPKHFMFSSLEQSTLPLNTTVKVTFWYVDKQDGKYFIHKYSDLPAFEQMATSIEQHCSNTGPLLVAPSVDEVVCAQNNGVWLRAVVQKVLSLRACTVLFLDFGFSEVVDITHMRVLTDELSKDPVFAVKVSPEGFSGPVELGTKVYSVSVSGNPPDYVVRLDVPVAQTESSPSSRSDSPMIIDLILLKELEQVVLSPGKADIIVYSFTSVESTFCAPFSDTNIRYNMELTEKITEYCKDDDLPNYVPLHLNEVVLAKCPDDGLWYRAAVKERSQGDSASEKQFTVLFFDYGSTGVVTSDSIRDLHPDFKKLPIQAINCVLGGFTYNKNKEQLVNEAIQTNLALYTSLKAEIAIDEKYTYVTIPGLVDMLVEKGLAIKN